MLPQIAPQLDIPKYIHDFNIDNSNNNNNNNNSSRPRTVFDDINKLVSNHVSPSASVSPLDEDNPSPLTPPPSGDNNSYYSASQDSYKQPPSDIYDSASQSAYSSYGQQSSGNYSFGPATSLRNPYLSDSPSPVDVHATATPQDHFSHASFNTNTSPSQLNSLLDQRLAPRSYSHLQYGGASPYAHPLHRSTSFRDLRHPQLHFSSHPHLDSINTSGLDEPLSPLNPHFSGMGSNSMPYSPIGDDGYGPSPPNTGTSSSSAPITLSISQGPSHPLGGSGGGSSPTEPNSKTYSFVALPGNAVKKRPRRRYDEIERLYQCSWPDCSKAYGTLNHLNAHVTMQKHGPKRSPNEFKELRKQWRKAKKEAEAATQPQNIRRSGLNLGRDSLFDYGGNNNHMRHPSLPGLGLPTSISVPHMGQDSRYALNMPLEDIRFPPDEHDDQSLNGYGLTARQRYGSAPGSVNSSWNHPSSSTRSSLQQQQAQNQFGGLNLSIPGGGMIPGAGGMSMNRLPPDSTLLTPLPGYEPPSLLPPLQNGDLPSHPPQTFQSSSESNSNGYDVYDDDAGTRPSTGHASIGRASGDEY